MTGIREKVCFLLSKRLMRPPNAYYESVDAIAEWRDDELGSQWSLFSDGDILGKDVLDFGSGFGSLGFFMLKRGAKRVTGIELDPWLIEQSMKRREQLPPELAERIRFVEGKPGRTPFDDASFDTITAFDVMEHVMQPDPVVHEWFRVLRPGGKVLIWWSPFRGPYGPHMEALVPIPWAHVIFGQKAMFRTAERIYDDPDFIPRVWDQFPDGSKRPNKWKAWSSFKEQGYINELTIPDFEQMATRAGFRVTRMEPHTFRGSELRRMVGGAMLKLPVVGEYFTSFILAELQKP